MKIRNVLLVVFLTAAAILCQNTSAVAQVPQYAEGEAIIMMRSGVPQSSYAAQTSALKAAEQARTSAWIFARCSSVRVVPGKPAPLKVPSLMTYKFPTTVRAACWCCLCAVLPRRLFRRIAKPFVSPAIPTPRAWSLVIHCPVRVKR